MAARSPSRAERGDLSRQPSKTRSFDNGVTSPSPSSKKSVFASTLPVMQPNLSGSSSPADHGKSPSRPTTARNELVRAASERWKSLVQTPKLSNTGQDQRTKRKQGVGRSKSSKSLAEFLHKSAPEMQNDDSFSVGIDDDRSIITTPVAFLSDSSSALGGARRRMRQNAISSSRSLPPRDESKSLDAPELPLERTARDPSNRDDTDSIADSSRS
jgi:hypothetical protein